MKESSIIIIKIIFVRIFLHLFRIWKGNYISSTSYHYFHVFFFVCLRYFPRLILRSWIVLHRRLPRTSALLLHNMHSCPIMFFIQLNKVIFVKISQERLKKAKYDAKKCMSASTQRGKSPPADPLFGFIMTKFWKSILNPYGANAPTHCATVGTTSSDLTKVYGTVKWSPNGERQEVLKRSSQWKPNRLVAWISMYKITCSCAPLKRNLLSPSTPHEECKTTCLFTNYEPYIKWCETLLLIAFHQKWNSNNLLYLYVCFIFQYIN